MPQDQFLWHETMASISRVELKVAFHAFLLITLLKLVDG